MPDAELINARDMEVGADVLNLIAVIAHAVEPINVLGTAAHYAYSLDAARASKVPQTNVSPMVGAIVVQIALTG